MTMRYGLGLGVVLLGFSGCDSGQSTPVTNAPAPGAPVISPGMPGSSSPTGTGGAAGATSTSVPPTDPGAATPTAPHGNAAQTSPAAANDAVKADIGVGAAGSSLKNETGVLVEPAKSLFATRERLVFEVAIPAALKLFNGLEGRMPKSHQEFMDKIVATNNIQLPRLPAGKEYFFDAERGELMVKPAAQPAP